MPRWLCECERTNAEASADCWSCGRPRPTTTDDVVARLTAEVEALRGRAELAEATIRRVWLTMFSIDGEPPVDHTIAADVEVTLQQYRRAVRDADTHVTTLTAERDEARGLLGELAASLNTIPRTEVDLDRRDDLTARIAAHLEGR